MTATPTAIEMARTAAAAAADKKAADITAIDVSDALVITDVFLLCTAGNAPQVGAIVDEVDRKLRQAGHRLARREGEREQRWVLLDYVDIVVHVQQLEEREHYALERVWKDCPTIPLRLGREAVVD